MKKLCLILFLILSLYTLYSIPPTIFARVTPEDIVNAKKGAYETRVKNYSPANQQKLTTLASAIAEVNKKRCEDLEQVMLYQAAILDEYQGRKGGVETEAIKDARYWLTFAHEAIDYQKARIYIFDLNGESNIKNDANNLISSLQTQLNYARSTAIKSQSFISKAVSGGGSQKIVDPNTIQGGD